MATPFLSSEEYDEHAHRLYDDGAYDSALETLKEGLRLYPHSVDLYVGLGYTRLAREEYAWARQAFERGLVLDPEHEDARVGLGEALLRLGQQREALKLFRGVLAGGTEDADLLLTMGRSLYREQLYSEAADVFLVGIRAHPDSAELAAGYGFTLHRLEQDDAARRELRRALRLDGTHHEARIYLGHILYDRGEWAAALRAFDEVPLADHYDALAAARAIELRRALNGLDADSAELAALEKRLEELESEDDLVSEMLAELEETAAAGLLTEDEGGAPHRVVLVRGTVVSGSWYQIVRQIRDAVDEVPGESVTEYMRRTSEQMRAHCGSALPTDSAHEFVAAGERVGLWRIER